MTDRELKKLAKYMINELCEFAIAPIVYDEDGIQRLGHHLAFFTDDETDQYDKLILKNKISGLQKLLEKNVQNENYETADAIFKKINNLKKQIKNQ